MIDFREYVSDTEQAYMGTLRSFRLLNEDGAVKMHKKFEKKFAEAINGVYREMISDIASKISTRMKNKPNPEADELFGPRGQGTIPVIQEAQPLMPDDIMPSPSNFAPNPSEIDEIRRDAGLVGDTPVVTNDPFAYMDMTEKPQVVEPSPTNSMGAMTQPTVQKRTIDADGKRV